jgi:mannose-1-phosphate guanylyltransferase
VSTTISDSYQIRSVVLAAGLGSRLKPITEKIPKCLVPIGRRPLLDYWIDKLTVAGPERVLINTHAHADQMRAYIAGINDRRGIRLVEFYERELLGSAGTISANPDFSDNCDAVVVIYADNLSAIDLDALLAFHRTHDEPITMALFQSLSPEKCGIAETTRDGLIIGFEEKPQDPVSDLANAGVYVFSSEIYREIAALKAFDIGFDVLPKYIGRMRAHVIDGLHIDIGSPESYQLACRRAREISALHGFGRHGRPAVFFDRDGTLIEHVHYLSRPEAVRLLPGAAPAIRKLQRLGYACVIVTNQSAIGRGTLSEEQYDRVHDRLRSLFAAENVVFHGAYHCPVVAESSDRTRVEHRDRKPGPGMLLRASQDLQIDVARSWMVGDMVSDVLAGINAGCRGSMLMTTREGQENDELPGGVVFPVVRNLNEAVSYIQANMPEDEIDERGGHGS